MNLREQRIAFTHTRARLIIWVEDNLPGYRFADNEVVRTLDQSLLNASAGVGIAKSLHLLGLAADMNLYINGVYQPTSEAHKPVADQWKKMHALARWGGDFKDAKGKPKPDGNHYSFEWEGRK